MFSHEHMCPKILTSMHDIQMSMSFALCLYVGFKNHVVLPDVRIMLRVQCRHLICVIFSSTVDDGAGTQNLYYVLRFGLHNNYGVRRGKLIPLVLPHSGNINQAT